EVSGDRDKVVPRADDDAAVGRLAGEPALRQERPDDDDGGVREREHVAPAPGERPPRACPDDDERDGEQHLLPRRHDVERASAPTGVPELGHHEVVHRKPHDEDVEHPDGASHSGPTATSVAPRFSTRTGYGKSDASSLGPSGSSTSSKPRARSSRSRASPGGSQWTKGRSVWGSSGNQRVGVATKTRRARRQDAA